MKAVLAVVIIGFSIYSLVRPSHYELKNDSLAWVFGFFAGILGGAYGMNGPPLVIFGTLRKWPPAHFRATLQGYFLPASMAGMCGYFFAGLWTPTVNRYYLWSLPGIVLASFLGRVINRRLNARQFLLYVHVGLIGIGVLLLIQAALALIALVVFRLIEIDLRFFESRARQPLCRQEPCGDRSSSYRTRATREVLCRWGFRWSRS